MAVQRVDHQAVEGSNFLRAKTQAVHAGVDHHIADLLGRLRLPARNLLERVQTGSPKWHNIIVGTDAMENDEAGVPGPLSEGRRFSPSRNEEVPAPGVVETLGRFGCA